MYEEVPNWSFRTFLTHLHGVVPDLRYGPDFDIDRYAAVGNSRWAKLLFDWWRVVRPIWPVAPDEMRYFDSTERERALDWFSEKGGVIDRIRFPYHKQHVLAPEDWHPSV